MTNQYTPHIDVTPTTKEKFNKVRHKLSAIKNKDIKQEDLVLDMLDKYVRYMERYRKW